MNQKDYIKFQIEDLLFELETETSKIVKNKKTFDCWFLLDFYTTFKQKKPGCNVTFNQFMATLQENKRYIVVNQNNINQHILFVKNNYEKSVVDEIANARNSNNKREETKNNVNKTEERVKKPVEINNAKNRYEDISDDESDDFRSIRIVMKNNVSNRNEYGYKDIGNKKQKTCVDNNPKKDILRTYNDYRTHMLDAFEISSAFMITTFNQAMIKKYGVCFDFKKAKANKPKYTWGKLSLYLDDCNDIFERIDISNVTYYRRKDASAQFLIDKRKNAHLKKYTNDNKNNKYSLEILIVNIFPVKTTAKINEIERIFEIVYGVAIQNLIPESSFESFLYKCKSPNMILKGAKQDAKVTLLPTHTEDYNVYGDLGVHGNAIAQEDMIINKLTSVIEPEVATKPEDIAFNYEVPVKSAEVFSCTDPDMATLLGKSDLNIPVMIQEVDDTHNLRLLFDKCAGSSYGLKREFFHLIQTINFSDDEYGFYNE